MKELSDIGKIEADSEYSTDIDKSEISEEKNEQSKQNEEKSNEDKENNQ